MRMKQAVGSAALVAALAVTATGCSSWPEGPPNPGTVRVFQDGDFTKTWQLAECDSPSDSSLMVTGSDGMGGRIVINITDGTGDFTEFKGLQSVELAGSVEEYSMDADGMFTAKGTYGSGEDGGKLKLEGDCTRPTA